MRAKVFKRKPESPRSTETSEQLRARLRHFAVLTRGEAARPASTQFPEYVTVLAGPLRRRAQSR